MRVTPKSVTRTTLVTAEHAAFAFDGLRPRPWRSLRERRAKCHPCPPMKFRHFVKAYPTTPNRQGERDFHG